MTLKRVALAALGATFLVGALAPASFAAPGRPDREGHGPRGGMMQELVFVRLLKDADTNKDGKITKEEVAAWETKLFDAADANKDSNLTPGEIRQYHKARMEEFREQRKAERAANDQAKPEEQAKGADAPPPPPPGPDGKPDGKPGHGPKHGGHHDMAEGRHGRDHGRDHGGRDDWDGPRKGPGMMPAAALIRFVDTDENGQISKDEAANAATKLFERMDRNKDGVISIDDIPSQPL
ncbi:calcium-binding protein [Rhizobium rhizoryzae]|uniref:calcium-binding protein n=1 Tax=Rhizobium rhizoryzae TaxID=451876 RepID=UPI002897D851|nr:calcium-binding protein [Rhizobium rhizoryzae]